MASGVMRILLTRPRDDSESLAAVLRERGHDAIISPLMEIWFRNDCTLGFTDVQAILATSANGLRALARTTSRRDLPIFAVGPQTAAEAHALGFANIENAGGDAAKLAEFVSAGAKPGSGILLHVAGKHHNAKLTERLQSLGYRTRTATLYEAVENPSLTKQAQDGLRARKIDAVMLFSPRSAALFVDAIGRAALQNAVEGLTAVCISDAAAKRLTPLPLRSVVVAPSPNQDSIVGALGKMDSAGTFHAA
jgi:uroporphyrinogen-III synthase